MGVGIKHCNEEALRLHEEADADMDKQDTKILSYSYFLPSYTLRVKRHQMIHRERVPKSRFFSVW